MDRRSIGKKRLDAFVDGAFAFSATLLAVGSGPDMLGFDDLMARFAHVPSFALSFLVILSFWWAHRQWGSLVVKDDPISNIISIFIMFLVMIFVFPLSFLTDAFLHWFSDGVLPGSGLVASQMEQIYILFGSGYGLLSASYALLYAYTVQNPIKLRVSKSLIAISKHRIYIWLLCVAAAICSILLTYIAPIERLIWIPMLPYLMLILYMMVDIIYAYAKRV